MSFYTSYHFLWQVERDAKIGKLSMPIATQQKVEILTALKKLGEQLQAEEEAFLESNSNTSLKQFEQVSEQIGWYLSSQSFKYRYK